MTAAHADWSRWLAERIAVRGVPGASLALEVEGDAITVVAGLADIERAAPVTPRTIFRLGSSTKLLTALLLVQLADEGRLDLDEPVAARWSEFSIADESARRMVTPRQLLSHTAGIYGDVFDETSTGVDALENYARDGRRFEQTSSPGSRFSYSNASFALAGRLTEIVTGEIWDRWLEARVLAPLGMTRTGVLWGDWPDRDVATSYLQEGPVRDEPFLRALAPAGSTPWGTASDLLRLGRALAVEGGAFHGAAQQMKALQVVGPTPTFARGWGLGVQRFDEAGHVWGHDGVVGGQMTFLRVAPKWGLHIALMSNGGDGRGLMSDLIARLSDYLGDLLLPAGPQWPAEAPAIAQVERYVGRYAVARASIDVRWLGGELVAEMTTASGASSQVLRRQADDPSGALFLARLSENVEPLQQWFDLPADGREASEALLYRGRFYPRRPTPAPKINSTKS